MSITPNYVPRSYKTLNVLLTVPNAQKAIEFYNSAFGAEVVMELRDDDQNIVHAEIRIEDTVIMIHQGSSINDSSSVTLQLYVGDVEGVVEEAVSAGAEVISPITEKFYGDRAGKLKDPFGLTWIISTHVEDLSPMELEERFHQRYL